MDEKKNMTNQDEVYHVESGQEVLVERFRPEDAQGVAACFKRVYNEGYPIKIYYDPELLIKENEAKRLVSIVSKTRAGQVVGHVGLFNSNPCNLKIFESGSGLVLPEYRNTAKLFTRMMMLSEDIGRQLGVEGIYGEPVCNHPYSQKMLNSLQFKAFSLEVDLMPAEAYSTEGGVSGRVSSFLVFKTLVPKAQTVYIPPVYKNFFHSAYKNLDDARHLEISSQSLPESASTRIKSQIFDFAHVLRMGVPEMGMDFEQVLAAKEREATEQGVICFQIWLNLAAPWVHEAVDILRENNYFLGGLLPRWFDTDGMLMQKLLPRPCWEDIHVAFEQDRFIVDAVRKDWASLG